jgi:hypothetical protein
VRFLDPKTNGILYPGPHETPGGRFSPIGAELVLNPLLAWGMIQWEWDTRRSFQTYIRSFPQGDIQALALPATSPAAARLEIRSPQIPWRVEVRPQTPNLQITVFDVVAAVHIALRTQLTPAEWEQLGDGHKNAILAARNGRVRLHDFNRALDELYCHPRRVDTLGEATIFAGLVPAPHRSPYSFDLKFVRRP